MDERHRFLFTAWWDGPEESDDHRQGRTPVRVYHDTTDNELVVVPDEDPHGQYIVTRQQPYALAPEQGELLPGLGFLGEP